MKHGQSLIAVVVFIPFKFTWNFTLTLKVHNNNLLKLNNLIIIQLNRNIVVADIEIIDRM